MIKKFA